MKLANLLSPAQVILDLKGDTCVEAISSIIDHLVNRDLLDEGLREEVLEALKAREQQISTGIGSGVAIPHAFSENIDQVVACFARSREGVDFESLDNAPVNYIVLLVVPQENHGTHLQTLAGIARMFNNCEIRKQLHVAETAQEVLDIFASHPDQLPCGK